MTAFDRRDFLIALAAMTLVVLASNILVQYPFHHMGLGDYLTWGAFTYPFSFLVTDLSNRRFGPQGARRVVYAGFVLAVILSVILATPRIAMASGMAFLTAQLSIRGQRPIDGDMTFAVLAPNEASASTRVSYRCPR